MILIENLESIVEEGSGRNTVARARIKERKLTCS